MSRWMTAQLAAATIMRKYAESMQSRRTCLFCFIQTMSNSILSPLAPLALWRSQEQANGWRYAFRKDCLSVNRRRVRLVTVSVHSTDCVMHSRPCFYCRTGHYNYLLYCIVWYCTVFTALHCIVFYSILFYSFVFYCKTKDMASDLKDSKSAEHPPNFHVVSS